MLTRKFIALFVTLTIIALGAAWLITDEPLDKVAADALDTSHRPLTKNNGFIYLLGLDANENEDPFTVGSARLLQHRNWLASPIITTPPSAPQVRTFRAPLWFDGTDESLFDYAKDIPYIIAANETLYSRYHAFLQFHEFETLINLNVDTTENLSDSLQLGNRFLRADVLSTALNKSTTAAAMLLANDITQWRLQLQLADTFAYKLLAARLIENDFSLITILAKKNKWSADDITLLARALEPFSLQEISLERPLLRGEFSKLGEGLLEAAQKPTLINAAQYNNWQLKLLYKPNMSINFLYREYINIANKNNLPPRQLSVVMKEDRQLSVPLDEWIKNSIGIKTVQALLSTDYLTYTANVWDLEVNRMLTRLVLEARATNTHTQTMLDALIQQPTFRGIWDNQPPHYQTNHQQLCYSGPTEDKKGWRCVDVSWLLHKAP